MKKEISVSLGLTVNMGNYESARIDLGLKEVVTVDNREQLRIAYDRAKAELSGKLQDWKIELETTGSL